MSRGTAEGLKLKNRPIITLHVRRRRREMNTGQACLCVCVCVCVCVPHRVPALLHGPDVTWGMVEGAF